MIGDGEIPLHYFSPLPSPLFKMIWIEKLNLEISG